jgi:hypothetical protein
LLPFDHANFAISATGSSEKVFTLEWALYHITRYPIDQSRALSIRAFNLFMRQHPPRLEILATSPS